MMTPLTGEYLLFPLFAPSGPVVWGWWSLVSGILLVGVGRYLWKKQQPPSAPHPEPIPPKRFTHQERLDGLSTIQTGASLPRKRAELLLMHLFLYRGIETTHQKNSWKTLQELQKEEGNHYLIKHIADLYEMIYTDSHITHTQIITMVQTIIKEEHFIKHTPPHGSLQ